MICLLGCMLVAMTQALDCPMIASDALGTIGKDEIDDQCCDALTAYLLSTVANHPSTGPAINSVMPGANWDTVAPLLELTECSVTSEYGACSVSPLNVADDAAMVLLKNYICCHWDVGCNVCNMQYTGQIGDLADSLLSPSNLRQNMACEDVSCSVGEQAVPFESCPAMEEEGGGTEDDASGNGDEGNGTDPSANGTDSVDDGTVEDGSGTQSADSSRGKRNICSWVALAFSIHIVIA